MAVQKRVRLTLVALLVATLFNGLCWAALIPMWHTPDEQAHFAQAQNLAAGIKPLIIYHNTVHLRTLTTTQDIVTSEKRLGTFRINGNNQFTYHPEYRIDYSNSPVGLLEEEIENLPKESRKEIVINEATGYPPLYYRYIAFVNRLFWSKGLITRLFLSRIATVLLSPLTVYVAFLLAREVFKNEAYALTAAALVSFQPMRSFSNSGVTSDALMNLVYPLGVLCLLKLYRKKTRIRVWSFLIVLIIGFYTKLQFAFLFLLSLPALAVSMVSSSLPRIDRHILKTAAFGLGLLLIAILMRHLGYNWGTKLPARFVLPEVGHLGKLSGPPSVGEYLRTTGEQLYRQGFPWYWGVYRWLSLTLPLRLYRVIKLIILASAIGWIGGIFKRQIKKLVNLKALLLVIASSLVYPSGILTWNFFFWKSHGYPIGIQGRYFFPNLPEHMILLLGGLVLLLQFISQSNTNRIRHLWLITVVVAMIIFNWYSLWFVSASYYDSSNWSSFWLQASQYKPWFFKTPFLPSLILLGVWLSFWFLGQLVVSSRKITNKSGRKKKVKL